MILPDDTCIINLYNVTETGTSNQNASLVNVCDISAYVFYKMATFCFVSKILKLRLKLLVHKMSKICDYSFFWQLLIISTDLGSLFIPHSSLCH